MTVTFNEMSNAYLGCVSTYDASAGTYSPNHRTESDFDYFPDDIEVGDAIYFGRHNKVFKDIKIYVGTPLVAGSISVVWEYTDLGGNWQQLTVNDPSSTFTVPGEHIITFDVPDDFSAYYANPTIAGVWRSSWIRCRVVEVTAPSEGGANSTQPVEVGDFAITITGGDEATPLRLSDICDADVANGWDYVENLGSYYLIHSYLRVGDGTTPTFLYSTLEMLEFITNRWFFVVDNATFRVGRLSSDNVGYFGSLILLRRYSSYDNANSNLGHPYYSLVSGGTLELFASTIEISGPPWNSFHTYSGTIVSYDSIITGEATINGSFLFNGVRTLIHGSGAYFTQFSSDNDSTTYNKCRFASFNYDGTSGNSLVSNAGYLVIDEPEFLDGQLFLRGAWRGGPAEYYVRDAGWEIEEAIRFEDSTTYYFDIAYIQY